MEAALQIVGLQTSSDGSRDMEGHLAQGNRGKGDRRGGDETDGLAELELA